MSTALVVVQPFADYAKGDRITDAEKVQQVLRDQPTKVNKIVVPDDESGGGCAPMTRSRLCCGGLCDQPGRHSRRNHQ
jgi:hypothetical protein